MKSIDDICRDIVAGGHIYGNPNCPYGRRPSFDDMWEDGKEALRDTVRRTLCSIGCEDKGQFSSKELFSEDLW